MRGRRFAQVSHEYLIEQVQSADFTAASLSNDLNFNHPVKELIWIGRGASTATRTTSHTTPLALNNVDARLVLNGHDRFANRDTRYFTRTQVWQHHTGFGSIINKDAIAVYSFALKPEEHQPSGTCNFSRIDNAQLKFSATTTGAADGITVFAVKLQCPFALCLVWVVLLILIKFTINN